MFIAPRRWRYRDFIRINAREVATSMGARTLRSTATGCVLACRDLPRGRKDSGSRGQSDRARRAARRQLFHAAILGSQGRRTAYEDLQLEITTKLPQYCTPDHVRDRMYRLPASSCM